jgi:hypothetical protein
MFEHGQVPKGLIGGMEDYRCRLVDPRTSRVAMTFKGHVGPVGALAVGVDDVPATATATATAACIACRCLPQGGDHVRARRIAAVLLGLVGRDRARVGRAVGAMSHQATRSGCATLPFHHLRVLSQPMAAPMTAAAHWQPSPCGCAGTRCTMGA